MHLSHSMNATPVQMDFFFNSPASKDNIALKYDLSFSIYKAIGIVP